MWPLEPLSAIPPKICRGSKGPPSPPVKFSQAQVAVSLSGLGGLSGEQLRKRRLHCACQCQQGGGGEGSLDKPIVAQGGGWGSQCPPKRSSIITPETLRESVSHVEHRIIGGKGQQFRSPSPKGKEKAPGQTPTHHD